MQQPPNNGQPPNWQGNQSQYPPQQPWGLPPQQPGQWGQQQSQQSGQWQPEQYNQPTQGWQPVPPPPLQRSGRPPKPPKKPLTKRDKIIGVGCLGVILLLFCGICSAIGNSINTHNGTTATAPTTIVAMPSDTPTTDVQAVLHADTPTIAPTDTSVPSPTPTPRPTATPTQPIVQQPTPTPTPHCVAVNNNPWCYNFIAPGNLITNPPSAFCSYFTCVSTFWTANHGYVAECANGSYTHSGGVSGACSRDGGVSQTLYSH